MPGYRDFTSPRPTPADWRALQSALQALDPTASVMPSPAGDVYHVKKATPFTPGQITATQNAIDTAPAATPQSAAQTEIDNWPIAQKAMALALTKQLNVIRSKLSPPLPDLTLVQVLAAIRNEAGTL